MLELAGPRPGFRFRRVRPFQWPATFVYEFYRTVTVAASMRGHGVMIPFGIHCGTISLVSHDKVMGFLQDIGRPEWGVELTAGRRPNRSADGVSDELWRILDRIDRNREQTHREVLAAQKALLARTARNMLHFGESVLPRARNFVRRSARNGDGQQSGVGTDV
eukprot:5753919-Prymnesium_polylepis.1